MRLWSIHPTILDQKGLGAAWREGLMAQSVILKLQNGLKPGYRNHPQLRRFLARPEPLAAIGTWLSEICKEAHSRQYNYDQSKILLPGQKVKLTVTRGQLIYEHNHILSKLKQRSLRWFETFEHSTPTPMAMFEVIEGDIEPWEKQYIMWTVYYWDDVIDALKQPRSYYKEQELKEAEKEKLAEWGKAKMPG